MVYEKRDVLAAFAESVKDLVKRDWQGNVRELENYVRRFILMGSAVATDDDEAAQNSANQNSAAVLSFKIGEKTMDEIETEMIEATLKHTKGDKNQAAKLLGLSLRTLYRKLSKDEEF